VRPLTRAALAICLAVGLLFIGQGAGLIPGSFMTGRTEWAVIGGTLAAIGALGLWWTTRPRA
jgi:hypothetical protein